MFARPPKRLLLRLVSAWLIVLLACPPPLFADMLKVMQADQTGLRRQLETGLEEDPQRQGGSPVRGLADATYAHAAFGWRGPGWAHGSANSGVSSGVSQGASALPLTDHVAPQVEQVLDKLSKMVAWKAEAAAQRLRADDPGQEATIEGSVTLDLPDGQATVHLEDVATDIQPVEGGGGYELRGTLVVTVTYGQVTVALELAWRELTYNRNYPKRDGWWMSADASPHQTSVTMTPSSSEVDTPSVGFAKALATSACAEYARRQGIATLDGDPEQPFLAKVLRPMQARFEDVNVRLRDGSRKWFYCYLLGDGRDGDRTVEAQAAQAFERAWVAALRQQWQQFLQMARHDLEGERHEVRLSWEGATWIVRQRGGTITVNRLVEQAEQAIANVESRPILDAQGRRVMGIHDRPAADAAEATDLETFKGIVAALMVEALHDKGVSYVAFGDEGHRFTNAAVQGMTPERSGEWNLYPLAGDRGARAHLLEALARHAATIPTVIPYQPQPPARPAPRTAREWEQALETVGKALRTGVGRCRYGDHDAVVVRGENEAGEHTFQLFVDQQPVARLDVSQGLVANGTKKDFSFSGAGAYLMNEAGYGSFQILAGQAWYADADGAQQALRIRREIARRLALSPEGLAWFLVGVAMQHLAPASLKVMAEDGGGKVSSALVNILRGIQDPMMIGKQDQQYYQYDDRLPQALVRGLAHGLEGWLDVIEETWAQMTGSAGPSGTVGRFVFGGQRYLVALRETVSQGGATDGVLVDVCRLTADGRLDLVARLDLGVDARLLRSEAASARAGADLAPGTVSSLQSFVRNAGYSAPDWGAMELLFDELRTASADQAFAMAEDAQDGFGQPIASRTTGIAVLAWALRYAKAHGYKTLIYTSPDDLASQLPSWLARDGGVYDLPVLLDWLPPKGWDDRAKIVEIAKRDGLVRIRLGDRTGVLFLHDLSSSGWLLFDLWWETGQGLAFAARFDLQQFNGVWQARTASGSLRLTASALKCLQAFRVIPKGGIKDVHPLMVRRQAPLHEQAFLAEDTLMEAWQQALAEWFVWLLPEYFRNQNHAWVHVDLRWPHNARLDEWLADYRQDLIGGVSQYQFRVLDRLDQSIKPHLEAAAASSPPAAGMEEAMREEQGKAATYDRML